MSLFSRLFGGKGAAPGAEPTIYKDFRITPTPIKESAGLRLSARIEKEIDGRTRSHTLIRADVIQDPETAIEASIGKAKQMIDEQGERLFD